MAGIEIQGIIHRTEKTARGDRNWVRKAMMSGVFILNLEYFSIIALLIRLYSTNG